MKHYCNLSNGLEWTNVVFDGFVRLQSTWLEQKRWSLVIEQLDYGFLLDVGGCGVIVYDKSSYREISRACWQGLAWVRYCCERAWLDVASRVVGRCAGCDKYFAEQYRLLSCVAKGKLEYIKRIASPSSVIIDYRCSTGVLDGNYKQLAACYRARYRV